MASQSSSNSRAIPNTVQHHTANQDCRMAILRCSITFLLVTIIVATFLLRSSDAAYRKPPFNGSIFGKRNALDYDNAKAMSAACEVAVEACQSWFPQNDSK